MFQRQVSRTFSKLTLMLPMAIALSVSGCEQTGKTDLMSAVEGREFESKMISSGNNRPSLSLSEENRVEVLVLLHEGVPEAKIRSMVFSDGATGAAAIEALQSHGFVENVSGSLRPKIAMMTLDHVAKHMTVREGVAAAAFDALAVYAPNAMKIASTIPGLTKLPPEAYSLYILSDVLLDSPQINLVEQQFLATPRPERTGGRYYLSIQEKSAGETEEAFGIFGNHIIQYNGILVGVYGNRRNPDTDFHMMGSAYLWPDGTSVEATAQEEQARRKELAKSFVNLVHGVPVDESDETTLMALGWLTKAGMPAVPMITSHDQKILPDLMGGFTAQLIGILENERAYLEAEYLSSPFSDEITFEEYFIWWYHLFYTEVTERLIAEGIVHLPSSGVATYVFVP